MDRQKNSGNNDSGGTVSHELADGLLRVTVQGTVELSAITSHVIKHQNLWAENELVLWDLRKVDPIGISSQDILNIKHAFAETSILGRGGSSAILISSELDLVARIAVTLSDNMKSPVKIRSFLKEKEAVAWLKTDENTSR